MDRGEKRNKLINAADELFHQKGFEHTSIADIAAVAEVPIGNVYYYFKTRGDLVKAVTEFRLQFIRAKRKEWEDLPTPRARLMAYLESFENRVEEFTNHGCPVGGLCIEANKVGGDIALNASAVFRESLQWIYTQFRAMGISESRAQAHAAQILSGRQGSVLLSNTFKDSKYIRLETARLKKWLQDISSNKERKKQ
jgi:TetR/AcrR family transcriptional regulator, transcriptional repressor for nem operon